MIPRKYISANTVVMHCILKYQLVRENLYLRLRICSCSKNRERNYTLNNAAVIKKNTFFVIYIRNFCFFKDGYTGKLNCLHLDKHRWFPAITGEHDID